MDFSRFSADLALGHLTFRRRMLYPAELRRHIQFSYHLPLPLRRQSSTLLAWMRTSLIRNESRKHLSIIYYTCRREACQCRQMFSWWGGGGVLLYMTVRKWRKCNIKSSNINKLGKKEDALMDFWLTNWRIWRYDKREYIVPTIID